MTKQLYKGEDCIGLVMLLVDRNVHALLLLTFVDEKQLYSREKDGPLFL